MFLRCTIYLAWRNKSEKSKYIMHAWADSVINLISKSLLLWNLCQADPILSGHPLLSIPQLLGSLNFLNLYSADPSIIKRTQGESWGCLLNTGFTIWSWKILPGLIIDYEVHLSVAAWNVSIFVNFFKVCEFAPLIIIFSSFSVLGDFYWGF